uniref:NADH-ubiquinone oxidoreductase chain 5 n=1 Tax=Pyrrhopeplus carduelis TaxID=1928078 RepID=A0A4Y1JVQ2_9HEMI|nr:NADH dehydrogenase subunit 5 [Pyrrhopeplus carduelis]APO08812.1 NADH dehydrogenase subunit 5 [Pyrrhopeplus carduelis]
MKFYSIWSFMYLFFGVFLFFSGLFFFNIDKVIFCDWEFFSLGSCSFVMTLLFDWMSLLFMGSVLLISSMVIYYSYSYMSSDLNVLRFLYLVLLFVFSMMFMIISPNLVSILIGWDGLGLVSYCLVIYFQNWKSYNAGMITILTNRVGDIAILFSIAWFLNNGSWHFLYYLFLDLSWFSILMLLLVLAAFTKSAQIPFSSWLPAAMAAPTPVSALVHSSTLVTAGVYLLIRFNVLFKFYNTSLLLFISIMTMFMSGLGASFEYDLSKIIALSTLSQLGLMMSILFIGSFEISFFHLLTHAFFKALLFLCAGLIIHCMNDTQDIRFMGALISHFPYTLMGFCVANMSLCGFPFLSGFYSKDLSVEYLQMINFNSFIYLIFVISMALTVFYTMRLLYYVLYGYLGVSSLCLYEEDFIMLSSMLFLILMGLFAGVLLSWFIFSTPIFIFLPFFPKLIPLIIILFSGVLMYLINEFYLLDNPFGLSFGNLLLYFFGNMWFLPTFSTYMIYYKGFNFTLLYEDVISMGWGEYLFSCCLGMYSIYLSKLNLILQNNSLKLFFSGFILFSFLVYV